MTTDSRDFSQRDRGRASRARHSALVAAASGAFSALAVCGALLATGAFEQDAPNRAPHSSAAEARPAASLRDLYARARSGVVLVDHRPPGVRPRTGEPTREDGVATGSGFVIDERGHIVTNHHVVAGRGTTTIEFDPDEKPVEARVVGRHPSTDLALVRVDPDDAGALNPLPLGDSGSVRVGDPAIALGNPFGLERSLTAGVVSAVDREIDAPDGSKIRGAVQTDASINSGNSGGPLLDARGRVIGVNSQGRADGIAFAVPVDTVEEVIGRLLRRGARR